MSINLNISEIAIITGDNKFKDLNEYIITLWKKNFPDDFNKYSVSYKIPEKEEDIKKLMKECTNNKINIEEEIKKVNNTNNISELNENKKKLNEKIDNIKDETLKKEMKKCITNITNTNYGTSNENNILALCEQKFMTKIIKDDKYKRKLIHDSVFKWYIGGKIDGVDEKNNVYEIKNRVSKLFYELRNYEKVQIMTYLFLHKSTKGYLIEALKNKGENNNINVISVDYDEKYFKEDIFDKIIGFISFFEKLITNEEFKINYLKQFN
jgi:hypothetical protein